MDPLSLPDGFLLGDVILRTTRTKYWFFHTKEKLPFLHTRMVNLETPELSLSETHDVESMMSLLGITYVFNNDANSSAAMNDTLQKSFKVRSPHSHIPGSV